MTQPTIPLPDAFLDAVDYELWGQNAVVDCYTAAQLRDYAAACVQAEHADVLRELLDWEAEYMQQAKGGDNSGRSDARAGAAREIHDHLRSSWDTRSREQR